MIMNIIKFVRFQAECKLDFAGFLNEYELK